MTSMRVDRDKSAKVWAKRMQGLVDVMIADGVLVVACEGEGSATDLVLLYKDGDTKSVDLRNEESK